MTQKGSGEKSRTEKATLVHQLNAQRRANSRLARSRGQILQRLAAESSPKPAPTPTQKSPTFDLEADRRRAAILENMMANSRVAESRRRYTYTVLVFAMIIATISLTSYKMLRNYLYLPSPSLLSRYFRNEIKQIKDLITNQEQLGPALDSLSDELSERKNNITKLGGVLAIDAMSMRPHVVITKDGLVEGVTENELVTNSQFQEFQTALNAYENYIKTIRNKTITDTFVYYYQPLDTDSRPFVVYVEASTQGKATGTQIDRLAQIANILEEKGFPVEGIAFDGDTTYSNLHREFFESYYQRVRMDPDFCNFSEIHRRSVISDPLHLLKRARYRLLSSSVHSSFENLSESLISLDRLREELNLPSVVFSQEKYTKMHDSLATQLFSLRNLNILIKKKNLNALAYFLPMCLLSASLSEKEMTVDERFSLLQVGFYYMISYYSMSQDNAHVLRQKKQRNNTHVCPFDVMMVREYCNTAMSLLKVLSSANGSVSLNRMGSNPLEHFFGLVRMRSRSVHTFQKMLQVTARSVLQQKLLHDFGEKQKIEKRLSYFAQSIVNNPISLRTVLKGDPRDVAFTLHCVFGLPIGSNNLMVWDVFSLFEMQSEIFENFAHLIADLAERVQFGYKDRITSTSISMHSGTQISPRLEDRSIIK